MSVLSLEAFPTEVLVIVTGHLLVGHLQALFHTGSHILHQKLLQGGIDIVNATFSNTSELIGWHNTTSTKTQSYGTIRLPEFIYELQNVRKLRIAAAWGSEIMEVNHKLLFSKWSCYLTHLELRHSSSYHMVIQPEYINEGAPSAARKIFSGTSVRLALSMNENPWLPFERLFPNLLTLIVQPQIFNMDWDAEDVETLQLLFLVLPPSLTCFGTTYSPPLTQELFALFPRSLTDFRVETPVRTNAFRSSPSVDLETFPSFLKHFYIGELGSIGRKLGESNLVSLRTKISYSGSFDLPPQLELLEIQSWPERSAFRASIVISLDSVPDTLTSLRMPSLHGPALNPSLLSHLPSRLTKLQCHGIDFPKGTPLETVINSLRTLPPSITDLRLQMIPWPTLNQGPASISSIFSQTFTAKLVALDLPLPLKVEKESWRKDLPSIQYLRLPNGTITETAVILIPSQLIALDIGKVVIEGRFLNFCSLGFKFSVLDETKILKSIDSWSAWRQTPKGPQDSEIVLLDGTPERSIHWSSQYVLHTAVCTELLFCPSQVPEISAKVALKIRPSDLPVSLKSIPKTYRMSYSELSQMPSTVKSVAENLILVLDDEQMVPLLKSYTGFPEKYIHPMSLQRLPNFPVPIYSKAVVYEFALSDAIIELFPAKVSSMASLTLIAPNMTAQGIRTFPPSLTKLEITEVSDLALLEDVYRNLHVLKELAFLTLPHHPTLLHAGFDLLGTSITDLVINPLTPSDLSVLGGEELKHLPISVKSIVICPTCYFTDEHIQYIPPTLDTLVVNTEHITSTGLTLIPPNVQKLGLATSPPTKKFYMLFASARRRVGGSFPITRKLATK